jgi:hypothetical protein
VSIPGVDELLRTVHQLEEIGKRRIAATRADEPCACPCHFDTTLIHVGGFCCERACHHQEQSPP